MLEDDSVIFEDRKDLAYKSLMGVQSDLVEPQDPEAYNLLGISYELEGDKLKASKFYRVAYYMDQTFGALFDNLERVCKFWYKDSSGIRWGLDG